ncbi:hypothetical protein [Amycolatopsis anabasis]|uniref:hypothetical protein n=1 Tax=Amycolatopsis anabasis TaxID=1840409 RepID=UPI00131E5774|nr:hypothetical protein [Amycolatopsis anabasis]
MASPKTAAMDNGRKIARLFAEEITFADLYLTSRSGTATGVIRSDVYVGTVYSVSEDDDVPSGWDFVVCGLYGPSSRFYLDEGYLAMSVTGRWRALAAPEWGRTISVCLTLLRALPQRSPVSALTSSSFADSV